MVANPVTPLGESTVSRWAARASAVEKPPGPSRSNLAGPESKWLPAVPAAIPRGQRFQPVAPVCSIACAPKP